MVPIPDLIKYLVTFFGQIIRQDLVCELSLPLQSEVLFGPLVVIVAEPKPHQGEHLKNLLITLV